MSIYIGKVRPSIMEDPIDKSIIEFFSEYKPPKLIIPEMVEEQKILKTTAIDGFIAGEMKALKRKNENVVSRDCAILDLDDVILSESDLVEVIKHKFNKFDYVLYPTVSHGIKGVRYRIVLPLSQSVGEREYKLLIRFLSNEILKGVIHEADQSNTTWSQIQLLPVLTHHVMKEQIVVSKGKEFFPVQEALKGAELWAKNYKADGCGVRTVPLYKNANQFKKGGSRYRNTTTELFESIVKGCEEGNRNNQIAKITGGLLARAVDVAIVLELIKVANSYFTEPLSEKEVEATFYSIAKKELGAN